MIRASRAVLYGFLWLSAVAPPSASGQARLGEVDFPTSVAGEAREEFLLGLGYLHSFEYDDAAAAFRAAQRLAPRFALAYWGEALSYDHPLWGEEELDAARAALDRLGPAPRDRAAVAATERERAYLSAVEALFGEGSKADRDEAYERAMARLSSAYPEDEDAAALHALAILGTSEGRDHETYMRAAAVAEGVLDRHPRHPGAVHYLIHAYDDPIHAGLGLAAARTYADIAPDAPHALHMPSHIFFAAGMWDDVISANERAWDASVARMEARGLPAASRNFHALFWVHYGYLQAGRWADAARVLGVAEASARSGSHAWTAAEMRAHHVAGAPSVDDSIVARSMATRRAEVGDDAFAANLLAVAARARERGEAALLADVRERAAELSDATGQARAAWLAIEGLAAASERPDSSVALLAAAHELYVEQPYAFGPPTAVVRPPAELLGDVLEGLCRYREAGRAYRAALARAPGRGRTLSALARLDSISGVAIEPPDGPLAEIRARARKRIDDGEIPSMAIAVVRNGRVIWREGLGWADREARRPASARSVYELGSMSKSIMATGALTLVERGLVGLDDPVAPALASQGLSIVSHEPGDDIRFWHLLNMRAGVPHGWMSLPPGDPPPSREDEDRQFALMAHSVFPPGEVYHYSNFSMSLPARVVEGLTARPFAGYMHDSLFGPLGMIDSAVGLLDVDTTKLATPYGSDGSPLGVGLQVASGGAGFLGSAADLVQYALFHLGELVMVHGDVLDADLLRRQHEFVAGSDSLFSLGWFRGAHMVSNGRVSGGSSWLSIVPAENLAVICLTNVATSAADETCGEIVSVLAPSIGESGSEFYEKYLATYENPYEPRPELTGDWRGTTQIGGDTLAVMLSLPAEGGASLRIGDSGPLTLSNPVFNTRGMFEASADGSARLPSGLSDERVDASLRLILRLDDGRLYGYLARTFGLGNGGYRLGSYVSLERSRP